MNDKIKKLVENISTLTAIELSQLVSILEKRLGVSANSTVIINPSVEEVKLIVEEQTIFDIILISAGATRVPVVKIIREVTNLGLKEASDLTKDVPKVIRKDVPKEEAEKIKITLQNAGATVELK